MKRIVLISLAVVAGCSEITTPAPNVYPGSCPTWDKDCERRFDARTLALIGEKGAAAQLMCLDKGLEALDLCSADGLPDLY